MSINWNAKLHDPKDLTKYGDSGDGKFSKKFGEGGFVIPAPLEVDAMMKKVPKGKLTTINELRTALAKKHKTDFTCPITTGIFSWIAAYAADELAQQGRKRITPYWRTLKSDGQIIPKYPGGIEAIRGKLEAEALWKSGKFPKAPTIPVADYQAIVAYYQAKAPAQPMAQKPLAPIGLELPQFTAKPSRFRRTVGAVNMVRIDEQRRQIFHSDGLNQFLDVLDASGNLVESLKVGNVPVGFEENGGSFFLTMIGTFSPSDIPRGELALVQRRDGRFVRTVTLLSGIPRPTHTSLADLNADGDTDLIVSMYGNNIGRLSWFERGDGGKLREHVILPRSGTLSTAVHDFNGDGHPDIAALVAQELEAMYVFLNDGKGKFEPRMIFQEHPLMGHSSFELTDFNRDGKPDFVVTSGDNGEYPSPPKHYHGIRVYLNRGGLKFEQSLSLPLNGAFKALARDYDHDGDTDIAAVSYFPNYKTTPRESFVYFENNNGRFKPNTFRTCISGRWLTMDAGDVDGDGDIDLALGNYTYGPDKAIHVPEFLIKNWEQRGPPVMILYNNLRQPKADQ